MIQDRILEEIRSRKDPEAATIASVAEKIDESPQVVSFVLDSFLIDDKGKSHYVGTGAGGGWVPEKQRTPEEELKRQLDDNIISQRDYDLRMELIKRGKDPRDAEAMQELLGDLDEKAKDDEIERARLR